jgi:signal transduction histidine kinase
VNPYSFSVLLFSFGVLLIAILGFAKRRDAVAIRFVLFSFSVCWWGFLYGIWTSQAYSPERTLFLIRLSEITAVFIPITWLHFVMEFVEKREPFRFFYAINYLVALLMAFLTFTPWFFTGVHEVPVFHYYKSAGPAFYGFLGVFLTLVPYAFYNLILAYRNATGEVKLQLRYLIFGWLISFIAGGTTFLPVFNITQFLFLLCLMPIYPVFIGLALIRYGLFDVEKIANAFQREKLMAIGTMAASLNHELRNPLFIARGKAETYFDHLDRGLLNADEKSKQVIDSMYAQLTRASDIMQRFSDFAKPFYNEVLKEKIVVKEAFENVLQLVSAEFALNKINITQIPSNGLSIYGNPRHFEEILFNLILNACHAMGERGGELKLNAYQPNGKVIVEIADTGPGIPKQNLNRIFEPFYSTKGSNGSGLGLYITKQLVERNGGKIKVQSNPIVGTTFRLEFKA